MIRRMGSILRCKEKMNRRRGVSVFFITAGRFFGGKVFMLCKEKMNKIMGVFVIVKVN